MRVGFGQDLHRTDPERPLFLGGVLIESPLGLTGHSDADVLTHAIIDALLGALGRGDIGEFFPDSDPQNKDRSSLDMLREVMSFLREADCRVVNLDCIVIAEIPKISPHKKAIVDSLSSVLGKTVQINIKAKTYEKLGVLGQSQAIEAQAVVLIK